MGEREAAKAEIRRIFEERVRGVKWCELPEEERRCGAPKLHGGSEGHWLEQQFGVRKNSKTEPDFRGFEMKSSALRTTIGDWSACEYLFSKNAPTLRKCNGDSERHLVIEKATFIRAFGQPIARRESNEENDPRFVWSGRACPKHCNAWSEAGQTLVVCPSSQNIYAVYSHKRDRRIKPIVDAVPDVFKTGYVAIAMWRASRMRERIDQKWNRNGFFQIVKNANGAYSRVQFGRPFDYEYFLWGLRERHVIFDGAMVENQSRSRNCSNFRVINVQSSFLTELYER